MSADRDRLYRYRARITRHPASIYDGHLYSAMLHESPCGRFRLDIDYGFRQWHLNVKCRLADVDPRDDPSGPCSSIKGDERPEGLSARDLLRFTPSVAIAHVVRDVLAPPVEIEIVCRSPEPVKYGRYLVDVYYHVPDATDWNHLADELLASGHAEPYTLSV
jgi:hypothetical protein